MAEHEAVMREGVIGDDIEGAQFTSDGTPGRFGNPAVGEAFRESYAEDDDGEALPMQEIEIEV
jgi:hypothetical protein